MSTMSAAERAAWLEERLTGVGASEAAAALGVSPYDTPLSLYLRKVGLAGEHAESEAMRWGTRLEPLLAEAYEERTGRRVERSQVFLRDPGRPCLLATLDGIDSAGEIVELKTIGAHAARGRLGDEGTDELPEHWLVQAHQQMVVAGSDVVHFGVLVGGQEFRLYDVRRDAALARAVADGVCRFWDRHVVPRVMPEPSAADAEVLSRVRPAPGREVTLTGDGQFWADAYAEAAREASRAKDQLANAKAHFLAAMGDAETARTIDGDVFVRKVVEVAEKTVTTRAYSYVRLTHKPRRDDA
jgi:putative phage-type endonuclease